MPDNRRMRLSRRERQIMDILYRREGATVLEIREELPDPPTASAVRAALGLLERKRQVGHRQDGPRNVWFPMVPREKASRSALRHVVDTFFRGSEAGALAALLESGEADGLSDADLDRLAGLVEEERRRRSEGGG